MVARGVQVVVVVGARGGPKSIHVVRLNGSIALTSDDVPGAAYEPLACESCWKPSDVLINRPQVRIALGAAADAAVESASEVFQHRQLWTGGHKPVIQRRGNHWLEAHGDSIKHAGCGGRDIGGTVHQRVVHNRACQGRPELRHHVLQHTTDEDTTY